MRFKYYVNPGEMGGWEVTNDEAEIMGIFGTEAEAHAAIVFYVDNDMEDALEARQDNIADHIIDQRKHER